MAGRERRPLSKLYAAIFGFFDPIHLPLSADFGLKLADSRTSCFIWLRQFKVGKNSADINRQLDRLEFLQGVALSPTVLHDIPAHRIARLRRQGERYFTDGLLDITSDRRLAILAVCVVEWAAAIADTVVETHDRIVGAIWRDAKRICDTRVSEAQAEIETTLAGFETLGATLLMAKGDEAAIAGAVDASCGWGVLENLVVNAGELRKTVKADALTHVEKGYHRFKLYAPRMLAALDIVFAATSLLGYLFIPRIRDLPNKRLHVFDPKDMPKEMKGLTGNKVRKSTIIANWPDVLRCVAMMLSGRMQPSQLLKKLAARSRQHDLAIALREIGRVERTLFIIEWLLDTDMQRRAQIGLNKGEAHHALKNALRVGRQGEIRDRTTEGQHFRIAGLNLLTAIIIYWNTKQLGIAVAQRKKAGLDTPAYLLTHISPLGWAHIILTGEYRWRAMQAANL